MAHAAKMGLMVGLAVAMSFPASPAMGQCIGEPMFNPPGGVSFSTTGQASKAGGLTFTFADIGPGAFDNLWWGPRDDGSLKLALDGNNDEPGETLILSEITDGDCSVSYGDYDVVNARWLDNTCSEVNDWYDGADANMSGTVDAEDLLALALLRLDTAM